MAVHVRTVGGLKVTNGDAVTGAPHLGVLSRHVGVVDDDLDVGTASDHQGTLSHVEAPPVIRDQPWLTFSAQEFGLDLQVSRFDVIVDEDLDLDRTDETESLTDGVLANGLFELAHQRLLESVE